MTIYISPNPGKTSASEIALRAAQILLTHGAQVLMQDGLIAADGSKAVVLTDERIGELFRVPVRLVRENGWYYATGY